MDDIQKRRATQADRSLVYSLHQSVALATDLRRELPVAEAIEHTATVVRRLEKATRELLALSMELLKDASPPR